MRIQWRCASSSRHGCSRLTPTRARLACVLLCLSVTASTIRAQEARADVAAQLTVVVDVRGEAGFKPDADALGRATTFGVLEDGGNVYLELTLDAAREYLIEARCDTGCTNIDARVLSPAFDLVTEDTLPNDAPKMTFAPTASGPHLLGLQMVTCAARICYFGVVVLSRPAR